MQTMVPVGADTVWAEDSGGSGTPLVLLHEGVGDSTMWDPIWAELTAVFRTIRYDIRGFGRSPAATEEFSLLLDLLAVLDHFGVRAVYLAGCSMGGTAALEFALAEPRRAESLVLLAPGITGYPQPSEPELEAEFEALGAVGDDDGLADLIVRIWGAAGPSPAVLEQARSAVRAYRSQDLYLREGEPVFDRLAHVSAPTVMMVGDKDVPGLIASNEAAAERIPGCELIRMPGVDHYPTFREPRLVLDTILRRFTA
jgi:3-oxoadipate enol-lactonase